MPTRQVGAVGPITRGLGISVRVIYCLSTQCDHSRCPWVSLHPAITKTYISNRNSQLRKHVFCLSPEHRNEAQLPRRQLPEMRLFQQETLVKSGVSVVEISPLHHWQSAPFYLSPSVCICVFVDPQKNDLIFVFASSQRNKRSRFKLQLLS